MKMCIKCLNKAIADYMCNFIEDLVAIKWQTSLQFSSILWETDKDRNKNYLT